jgi:peptidoglycan/xylan/chitin deacetylase (PgdA/CDA1 family)
MKFYVFKLSTILKVLLFITAILFSGLLLLNYNDNAVIAFKTERQIPIYSVDCEDKKIAVTFDCAWGSDDIASILQTLKEHDVKATFFLVGTWAKKYPESVKMISDNGHDIANHSYTHVKMGNIDNGRIREEIIRCDKVLKDITGKQVDLFRPPYGEYNNNVVSIASQLNHYTIQWDVELIDTKVKSCGPA